MKYIIQIIFLIQSIQLSIAQEKKHVYNISKIYNVALTNGKSYEWLDYLSNQIGGRLSGSLNADRAVKWGFKELNNLDLDKVFLEDVMVPKWVRGTFEYASIITGPGMSINVPICSLGGSIATPASGLRAQVIEVKSFEELEVLGMKNIKGKFVFFNRPMPAGIIDTFEAYSVTRDQRSNGAERAAKYGAVGVIIRSMNLKLDDYPHTGNMSYGKLPNKMRIPAAAISTNGAELLSSMLSLNKNLYFYLKQDCKNLPDVKSYNVIGEIKGSDFPNEIIVVGGHLDSWDLGDGAHDDGAGIVQSMEVLNIFNKISYKPKRTIRVVLYMNEENGLRGGITYAKNAKNKKENHVFALESDAGGFSPRGFSFEASDNQFKKIKSWETYFHPYLTDRFTLGGSGADIGPLRNGKIVLAGLRPDSQRYFEYHHTANDTFEAINKRELELGAAAMTSMIYLVDQHGL
ncbi:MAG: peptidase M28 family protein [Flavobacteriaceae bacterium]|nr:peptidase M28 family protein [Flavobacteriaceae bacterium]